MRIIIINILQPYRLSMPPFAHQNSNNPSLEMSCDDLPNQSLLTLALIKHYDHLVEYVRRRFGNHGFAQDVVQDVCVRVMERKTKEPIRIPLALLKRISHDIAVDRCRAEDSRHAFVNAYENLPEVDAHVPCASRILNAKQELQLLAEAVAALPERCRIVFIMHKIHELPQAEVAARLNISIKMVEKHLRTGMLSCRTKLSRHKD